ncbi:MAG: YdcF family protein [Eubacterium sp.]
MKLIIIIVGVFILLAYIIPLRETKLNIGNVFGAFAGLSLIFTGAFLDMILAVSRPVRITVGIPLLFAWLIFSITLTVIINASKKTATNEEIVIVLGCRVKWDRPSLALVERCNAAAEHLKKNPNSVAILSGGQGKDENMTEARCMYNLLLEMGIDSSRLYLEEHSTSTDENICFSKKLIEAYSLSGNIAVATSEYHQLRAKMICRRYGINPSALPSKTVNYVKPPFYTREVFGVLAMLLKIR